ncbi:MAG TPA: glycosyltransferase [Solirubrobacterales bacterium]|nr:glycosyltransferase [Solirubrobacterales bacterium]
MVVAARNEADRIGATVATLAAALPGAEIVVADDASTDQTAEVARAHGARVVSADRSRGKGANASAAVETVIHRTAEPAPPTFLLCDGDLGESAGELEALVGVVDSGEADLAIAAFATRVGGGFGVALGFARWAIERRCGYRAGAPISGQRAMTAEVLRRTYPFAPGYGMEIGITVDAVRGGFTVREVELDLAHRATGRTLGGFLHRARQLRDFVRVWWSRR